MGFIRIVVERDFGRISRNSRNHLRERMLDALSYLRGWTERDIETLEETLADPRYYDGGIVKLTQFQFRALEERNRRVAQNKLLVKISPLLVWVRGRGLFPAIKKD